MNPGQPLFQCSEEMLINTASRGDLDAFNQLMLIYQDLAYHHAHALLRDLRERSFDGETERLPLERALAEDLGRRAQEHPHPAEDATQDSFIQAFQNMAGFRGGSFRAWLIKIVKNLAYDMLRRAKRHPMQSLYPEDEYGDEIEAPVWLADTTISV